MGKLRRLLRYIRHTKDRSIVIRPGQGGLDVRAYIDAAYDVHADFKSLTGSAITIGAAGTANLH